MPGLDWPFTPIPRLSERFARQNRFSPPPTFRQASTYPGIDRPASGLPPVTQGCCQPLASRLAALRDIGFPAAPRLERLTSPLNGTPRPVFQNGRTGRWYPPCGRVIPCTPCRSVTVWFQALFALSLEMLFSVRSRYYSTIGLKSYLGLEVLASRIPTRYPTHGTLDTSNHLFDVPLRGCHPLRLDLS